MFKKCQDGFSALWIKVSTGNATTDDAYSAEHITQKT